MVIAMGLELALVAITGVAAVAAVISQALTRFSSDQQADTISWAYHLGGDVADALAAPREENAARRKPSIR